MPNPLRHPRVGPNNVVWNASYADHRDAYRQAQSYKRQNPAYRYRIRWDPKHQDYVLVVWDSNL